MPRAHRAKKVGLVIAVNGLRVGIYARVSTEEQAQEGHSIEAQLRLCREFAARKGWVVIEEYTDPGYSGTNDQRPAFQRMIDDVYAGKIQVIVFHKLDRFSRSLPDILYYFRELESRNIMLASTTEAFDFSDPASRAQFHMLAVFAQWYIDNLSAETKKGKKQRALKGLYNGRLPFGYQPGPDGVAQVVPAEAEAIRQAFDAYATGKYTDKQVAELLNTLNLLTRRGRGWSKDSVRDFLQNEFYLGLVKYHGDLLPGQHEAIINQETFDACQQVRASHHAAPRSHATHFKTYLLAGLLRCVQCDQTLRSQSSVHYRYYRDMTAGRGLSCPDSGLSIKAETVEAEVGAVLSGMRLKDEWQAEIRSALASEDERARLLERRRFLEGKLRRLGVAYVDGVVAEAEYQRERSAVQAELAGLVVPENVAVVVAGLYLETLSELWAAATLEEQKQIAQIVLEAVYYDLRRQRVTELAPKPVFLPLFREIPALEELEAGRFRVRAAGEL